MDKLEYQKKFFELFKDLNYESYEEIISYLDRCLRTILKVKKSIINIAEFVTDIRSMERKEQAAAIKNMYGCSTVQNKIAFKLLDEENLVELEEEFYKEEMKNEKNS